MLGSSHAGHGICILLPQIPDRNCTETLWVSGDPAAQCQDLSSGWWVYTKATLPVPSPFPCLQTGNQGSWLQAATVKPANAATGLWFLSSEMQHTVACLSVQGILNLFVGCVYSMVFCLLVCILRQALMQPRLALNSLYSWGWTWTLDALTSTSWAQALQVCSTNPAVFWVCVFNFRVKDIGPSLLSFLPLRSLPAISGCSTHLCFHVTLSERPNHAAVSISIWVGWAMLIWAL